jgi:hypothetical protein
MNRTVQALAVLSLGVVAACGSTAELSPTTPVERPPGTAAPRTAAPSTADPMTAAPANQNGGGDTTTGTRRTPTPTVKGDLKGSPFGRHDTPPGSVATFLDFNAGGGGCAGTPDPGPPSIDIDLSFPPVVCGFNFNPDGPVELVLHGPKGWQRKTKESPDETGTIEWDVDDLATPIQGDYAIDATQGTSRVVAQTRLELDSVGAVVLPSEIRVGQTAHLLVAGGPPTGVLTASLYRAGSDHWVFAATIGKVHLDASGEARIALKSQEGDPSGRYLVSLGKGVEAEFALSPASNPKVARIMDGLRRDLSHCNERKENLPPRTVAAVECRPDADLVESVGFFLFAKKADMLDVYTTRLAANGVEGDGGDCLSGEPGDKPWTSNGADRAGCFLNSQGNANTRFTISKGPLYIGVLGNDDDIASLMEWSTGGSKGTDLWSPQ